MSDPCTTNLPLNKKEFINQWISEATLDETNTEVSSNYNTSTVYSSSVADGDEEFIVPNLNVHGQDTKINIKNNLECLQNVFNSTNNTETIGNVTIEKSEKIHIGNITYVTGPIYITNNNKENIKSTKETLEKNIPENEKQEINSNSAFVGFVNRSLSSNVLPIIERRTWLAQKALEPYDYLQEPAKFIIISHTATEMATTQADNIYLVRHIQCFHIESNKWNDISYNFLIGGDGNVYEGRGWGVVGAHTLGYNSKSLGISFIGCFMRELPLSVSIEACKNLIKRGTELGHISSHYQLLAHCQCRPTESPGKKLFEELKSWPQFCNDT